MSRRGRRDARAAAERRARRRSFLAVVAIGVAVVVVGAIAFALLAGGKSLDTEAAPVTDYPYPVQFFPPDPGGRTHFAQGETYDDYNSNPPTSGPHTAVVAPGVYDTPVPKESAVHNMEHGQVVVWYNCSGGPTPLTPETCRKLRDDLASIVVLANDSGQKIVMTPYANMEHRVALTAWQFLDAFDEVEAEPMLDARVVTFIDTFYCRTNLEGFC